MDAKEILKKLNISSMEYHIFLCCEQSNPKCSSREESMKSWEYLKKRLKDLNLSTTGKVFRTRANCLRVCIEGPIMCIYPDGKWYKNCNLEVIEEIIQNLFVNYKPEAIEKYRIY